MNTGSLQKTRWIMDASHSNISFAVKHLMISNVIGEFDQFDASIYTTDQDFTTLQVDIWIDAASINTGNKKRDFHLRSADFFDVEKFSQIYFVATSIEKPDKHGNQDMWGELTMHGITKVIKLNVRIGGIIQDQEGKTRAGFTVSGSLNRSDWGLKWNQLAETGGVVVSNEVQILCEVELVIAEEDDSVLKLEAYSNATDKSSNNKPTNHRSH